MESSADRARQLLLLIDWGCGSGEAQHRALTKAQQKQVGHTTLREMWRKYQAETSILGPWEILMTIGNINGISHERLFAVPPLQQGLPYTCGPASLSMVLAAHRKNFGNEENLAQKLGTDSEWGTDRSQLERVGKSFGLAVKGREWMTLDDLRRCVCRGELVIILYQAWRDEVDPTAWERDWKDGHYSVVVGVDHDRVYLADPWIGKVGWIPHRELLQRWHDQDRTGKRVNHFGLAFESATGGRALPEIANPHLLPRIC